MTKTPKVILSLLTIVAVAALAPGFASARKGSAAGALPTTTVSIGGTTNDGFYFPGSITAKLGKSQIVFTVIPESGQHNVFLQPWSSARTGSTKSTKGVSFPNMRAPIELYTGDPAYYWPRTSGGAPAPWKPTKKGNYFLYCTKHPGSGANHVGGMTLTIKIT
ncbi:MAG: hypothetical protein WCI34_02890 [Actinomycetes bacterium]